MIPPLSQEGITDFNGRQVMKSKRSLSFRAEAPVILLLLIWLSILSVPAFGRAEFNAQAKGAFSAVLNADPNLQYGFHDVGSVAMTITNFGLIGTGYLNNPLCNGETCPSCEYPTGSELEYLFSGMLWIGAVVGQDTLVSVGSDGWLGGINELMPDAGTEGAIIIRSNNSLSPYYSPEAVAEREFVSVFTDTFTDPAIVGQDPIDNRPHIPLNIEVRQTSYAWSEEDKDDFIIFGNTVKNIGVYPLHDIYIGIHIDGDVYHRSNEANGYQDDIAGFIAPEQIAYIMDNDGDPPVEGLWDFTSPRSAIGIKIHSLPGGEATTAFNWWISNGNPALDFGPRLAGTTEDPFYSFGAQIGTPTGDKNKYYMMRHPEFDYDQLFTAVSHEGEGFLPPPIPTLASDLADGHDTKILVSSGPYDLEPGEDFEFFFSVVMGKDVHVGPDDFTDYFDASNPDVYYETFDFSSLIASAEAADSVYIAVFESPADVDFGADDHLPGAYSLSDNHPNPFNPSTTIEYALGGQALVELSIYDILGRKVRTLIDENKPAGDYSIVWDGRDDSGEPAATGIYFYRIKTDDFTATKKMLLLK